MAEQPPQRDELDPVYRNTRREAIIIVLLWLTCLVWTVGYCGAHGYDLNADEVTFVIGVPSWVFFGVLVPWIVAGAFSIAFAMFCMADDDLGEGDEIADPPADARADEERRP